MSIVTIGDGLGWASDEIVHLGRAIREVAGRGDKTAARLERLAIDLLKVRDVRPEYNAIAMTQPFSPPKAFPSLALRRKAVCAVLASVVDAVEREMRAASRDPAVVRLRDRAGDESLEWGMHESPFISGINEALYRLEEVEISPEANDAFRASQSITDAKKR